MKKDGTTPLLYAALKKYTEIARIIIQASKRQDIEEMTIQATNKVYK